MPPQTAGVYRPACPAIRAIATVEGSIDSMVENSDGPSQLESAPHPELKQWIAEITKFLDEKSRHLAASAESARTDPEAADYLWWAESRRKQARHSWEPSLHEGWWLTADAMAIRQAYIDAVELS